MSQNSFSDCKRTGSLVENKHSYPVNLIFDYIFSDYPSSFLPQVLLLLGDPPQGVQRQRVRHQAPVLFHPPLAPVPFHLAPAPAPVAFHLLVPLHPAPAPVLFHPVHQSPVPMLLGPLVR